MDYLLVAKVVLCLAGAAALIFLAIAFKKLGDLLKETEDAVKRNSREIDDAIAGVSQITSKVDRIAAEASTTLNNVNGVLSKIEPDIKGIMSNVNGISSSINGVTGRVEDVTDSVANVIGSVNDNVQALADNLGRKKHLVNTTKNNLLDKVYFIKSVIENLKK